MTRNKFYFRGGRYRQVSLYEYNLLGPVVWNSSAKLFTEPNLEYY